jgi:hypothetical protein
MFATKPKRRHALRQDPLHEPGESLGRTIDEYVEDKITPWWILGIFGVIATIYEWIRWYFNSDFHPIVLTVVTGAYIGYLAYRVRRARPHLENLRKGLRGERLAGQFLQNELLPLGYRVIHDIEEDGFNIDHAVVGPKGVFAIETKAFSRNDDGEAKVIHEGETMLVNGFAPDRNPIAQAEATADHLAKLLPPLTGKKLEVQPVVLVAGCEVERRRRSRRTWVVNFGGLLGFLENEPERLTSDEVGYLTSTLAKYQRDCDKFKKR